MVVRGRELALKCKKKCGAENVRGAASFALKKPVAPGNLPRRSEY